MARKTRFTKLSLIAVIEEINEKMKNAGSAYSFKYSHRCGYHAVDLFRGDDNVRNIDCNETPRVLADRVEDESEYYITQG